MLDTLVDAEKFDNSLKLRERVILDLHFPENRLLVQGIRNSTQLMANDYRQLVPGFVNDVLDRIPESGPVLYSAISLSPEFTVQALSYFYDGQRCYKVAVNVFALGFNSSDIKKAGSLTKLPGFEDFDKFLPLGTPLETLAHDFSMTMLRMDAYLRGEGVDELSLQRI